MSIKIPPPHSPHDTVRHRAAHTVLSDVGHCDEDSLDGSDRVFSRDGVPSTSPRGRRKSLERCLSPGAHAGPDTSKRRLQNFEDMSEVLERERSLGGSLSSNGVRRFCQRVYTLRCQVPICGGCAKMGITEKTHVNVYPLQMIFTAATIFIGLTGSIETPLQDRFHRPAGWVTPEWVWGLVTGLFVVELVVGISASGRKFFTHRWNNFNLLSVGLAVLYFLLLAAGEGRHPSLLMVRCLRLLRDVQLVPGLEGVHIIEMTIWQATDFVSSVGVLLAFVLLFFGIVGVQFFGGSMRMRCAPAPFAPAEGWADDLALFGDTCAWPLVNTTGGISAHWNKNPSWQSNASSNVFETQWKTTGTPGHAPGTTVLTATSAAAAGFASVEAVWANWTTRNPLSDTYNDNSGKHCRDPVNRFCVDFFNASNATRNTGGNRFHAHCDAVGPCLLTMLRVLSLEGWSDLLYDLFNSDGVLLPMIFIFGLIFIGNFMAINIITVVLCSAFGGGGTPCVLLCCERERVM